MNVLENYLIQLFQHKNMIANEQTLKERLQLYELTYDLQLYNMCLETPHTVHSLPLTNITDQSQTFPFIANTSIQNTDI